MQQDSEKIRAILSSPEGQQLAALLARGDAATMQAAAEAAKRGDSATAQALLRETLADPQVQALLRRLKR